jgi:hypothetical protein
MEILLIDFPMKNMGSRLDSEQWQLQYDSNGSTTTEVPW